MSGKAIRSWSSWIGCDVTSFRMILQKIHSSAIVIPLRAGRRFDRNRFFLPCGRPAPPCRPRAGRVRPGPHQRRVVQNVLGDHGHKAPFVELHQGDELVRRHRSPPPATRSGPVFLLTRPLSPDGKGDRPARGAYRTASAARASRRSYPSRVPSRSMLVSRISPAPHSSIRADQSTASIPVGVRPPWVYTSHSPGRPGTARASIATTVHWLPNRSAALLTNSRSATPAVLIAPLAAPPRSRGDPAPLAHAASLHVQARYDPLGEHVRWVTAFPSSRHRRAGWSRRRSHARSPPRTTRRPPSPEASQDPPSRSRLRRRSP